MWLWLSLPPAARELPGGGPQLCILGLHRGPMGRLFSSNFVSKEVFALAFPLRSFWYLIEPCVPKQQGCPLGNSGTEKADMGGGSGRQTGALNGQPQAT